MVVKCFISCLFISLCGVCLGQTAFNAITLSDYGLKGKVKKATSFRSEFSDLEFLDQDPSYRGEISREYHFNSYGKIARSSTKGSGSNYWHIGYEYEDEGAGRLSVVKGYEDAAFENVIWESIYLYDKESRIYSVADTEDSTIIYKSYLDENDLLIRVEKCRNDSIIDILMEFSYDNGRMMTQYLNFNGRDSYQYKSYFKNGKLKKTRFINSIGEVHVSRTYYSGDCYRKTINDRNKLFQRSKVESFCNRDAFGNVIQRFSFFSIGNKKYLSEWKYEYYD